MNPDLRHVYDPVVRGRLNVLAHMDLKANDRARFAGIEVWDLPDYLKGLKTLGLLDPGERLTAAGNAYLVISLQNGRTGSEWMDKRDVWRRIGGDEPRLDSVLESLLANGLIWTNEVGQYAVAQAHPEGQDSTGGDATVE